MRLLIFCSSNEERMDLETTFKSPNLIAQSAEPFGFGCLKRFSENPDAIMFMCIKHAQTGFRVPKETTILFTGTVQDGRLKEQARFRAELGV